MSQLVGGISDLLSQEADNAGLTSNLFFLQAMYDSDQRRLISNITDNTYSFKIPTDNELQELAVWQEMNSVKTGRFPAYALAQKKGRPAVTHMQSSLLVSYV